MGHGHGRLLEGGQVLKALGYDSSYLSSLHEVNSESITS
ncbi:hypothetical protein Pla123a_11280 [Posidoniimonas polymericola]|uniref:Uncharacterized protein n=1 Tax=Posidoniimonas polymericola TaxID=2528002 RepID=A0A5C5YUW5_9BACT|nr:hypothetical protein Pla123a_11280 [Posidoniimonas polymericola]